MPYKIIYYKDLRKSLLNFAALHQCTYIVDNGADSPQSSLRVLSHAGVTPSSLQIWRLESGSFYLKEESLPVPTISSPIAFLQFRQQTFLIKSASVQHRCDHCHTFFSVKHNCTARKRAYYFHHVSSDSRGWFLPIRFFPVGAVPGTRRLFVIYDIETYTKHTEYGKQLVPYLLVFKLQGDIELVRRAALIAEDTGFQHIDSCFVLHEPQKDVIGRHFGYFREQLQQSLAESIWETFKQDHQLEGDLSFGDIKPELLDAAAHPQFVELIVIGHNITGFDEIVLASHTLDSSVTKDKLKMFNVRRNFLPRAGKLLFNDIVYSLPNPQYVKPDPTTYERWRAGRLFSCDLKWQGLRCLVRDTYLLTHTSLRNAASCYHLNVSKGACPYGAVNEFYMTGSYEKDEAGVPARRYWDSDEEWIEAKKVQRYDIITEAIRYCILDVNVTAELVDKLYRGYQQFCQQSLLLNCEFNIFQRPTISSNTHAFFRQLLYRERNGSGSSLPSLVAPSEVMYDHVRASVRGGRCYPTYFGVCDQPIFVYDICGMYASALTHPMPSGIPLDPFTSSIAIRKFQNKLDEPSTISYFDPDVFPMIVVADCSPPPLEQLDVLPPLCSKKSGRLCWTNEPLEAETLTTIDLIVLHNRGWRCQILTSDFHLQAVWPEWATVCRDYVTCNIEAKEKADREGNSVQRSISKLLSNALYGSFATRLDNKKVLFLNDIAPRDEEELRSGLSQITSFTSVVNAALPLSRSTDLPQLLRPSATLTNENALSGAFIGTPAWKPITHLELESDDLVLATIEKVSSWTKNDRYATQIASFVLAWTRAFMSEWCDILYSADRGVPYSERTPKSVYGDTDSLFLTQEGHQLMMSKGAHRLKASGNSLVFDPANPKLTWLVECETMCSHCKSPAYATESVYLAPKLYGLRDCYCPNCDRYSPGKLRAKGHAKNDLSYEMLKECFFASDAGDTTKTFQTKRVSLKKSLMGANSRKNPFTVTEGTLTRILRPWQDTTLWRSGCYLFPYDQKHPNPRPQPSSTHNPFWDDS